MVCMLPTFLMAQIQELNQIHIQGLQRTKPSVVRNLIPLKPSEILTDEKLLETENLLSKSGIFSSVQITTAVREVTDSVALTDIIITVEEKWSLIPIPYFSSNGETFNTGLFLIEANLLGYNTFLMTALYGGSNGLRSLFVFSNPSIRGSRWSHTFSGGYGNNTITTILPDSTLIRSYSGRYLHAGAGIGYDISPTFKIETTATYRYWDISSYQSGLDSNPMTDTRYVEIEQSLMYDHTRLADVLSVGTTYSLSSHILLLDSGYLLSTAFSHSISVHNLHRLKIDLSGAYGALPPTAEESIDGKEGYRTLPFKGTAADYWASSSIGFDYSFLRTSWASFIVSHFWEYGMYGNDSMSAPTYFGGLGFGFRLYLRKVAIPAVGVDIAYNLIDPSTVVSISVGVQM